MRISALLIFLFSVTIKQILSLCSMKQECDIKDPKCLPDKANYTNPKPLSGSDIVCKEYLDKDACCSNGQNILLTNNFETLGYIFGNEYGGCDICAINLKRLWCEFTCSPNQSDFVSVEGYKNFTIDNENKTLLVVNLTLNKDMNCQLFKSCKKTRYASELPLLANAIGFTSFQGAEANRVMPIFIRFDYQDNRGMNLTMDDCSLDITNKTELHGFPAKESCRCNSCSSACKFDNKFYIPALEGFNVWIIIAFYLFVIITTLIVQYLKKYNRKGKLSDERSRNDSVDVIPIPKKNGPINDKTQSSSDFN